MKFKISGLWPNIVINDFLCEIIPNELKAAIAATWLAWCASKLALVTAGLFGIGLLKVAEKAEELFDFFVDINDNAEQIPIALNKFVKDKITRKHCVPRVTQGTD